MAGVEPGKGAMPLPSFEADSELAAEISAAARCGEMLERMGVRIVFRNTGRGGLEVELHEISGPLLHVLTPPQLFELIGLEVGQLRSYVDGLRSMPRELSQA